jgi:predicted transcriptional regulator
MALSQSAVSELLDASRAGDGVDLIRDSVRLVMQELIEAVAALRNSPTNVRYADLYKVCTHYFGKPRQEKTSHAKFETPESPRV